MPKAMIVYASLTGNTEEMANLLAKELNQLGVTTEVEEAIQVYPEEYLEYDICIVATYTYGTDGNLPDEIIDFYEDLAKENLSGKVFGVLGSGQTFYEHFCRAVDYFEKQFKATGAIQGAESVKIELNVSEHDQPKLTKFANDLVNTFKRLHP